LRYASYITSAKSAALIWVKLGDLIQRGGLASAKKRWVAPAVIRRFIIFLTHRAKIADKRVRPLRKLTSRYFSCRWRDRRACRGGEHSPLTARLGNARGLDWHRFWRVCPSLQKTLCHISGREEIMVATGHVAAGNRTRFLGVIGFAGLIERRDVLVRSALTDLRLVLASKIVPSFVQRSASSGPVAGVLETVRVGYGLQRLRVKPLKLFWLGQDAADVFASSSGSVVGST
jgi:hypothetical protein